MNDIDLNLLVALDALLAEGSVTAAAHRLGLSASAMSRTLKRLRATTGDRLLVRAGRGLVPTPHAAAIRDRVHALAHDTRAILRPAAGRLDLNRLDRTFTIRANPAFVEFLAAPLLSRIAAAAPNVRLRFAPRPDKNPAPLRQGLVDLEIGVVEPLAPEICTQPLFSDRLVGVTRAGHALLHASRSVTPTRYAACQHVAVSPQQDYRGAVDDALATLELARDVRIVVPGFLAAMHIAGHSDLVATVPHSCLGNALTGNHAIRAGLADFSLPVSTPAFTISSSWHPRVDADPAHGWLRRVVMSLCQAAFPQRTEATLR